MHCTHARGSRELTRSVAIVLAIAALPQAVSHAAEPDGATGLGEIVVTAQKRAQTLQEVPISILVSTGEQLLSQRIDRLEDLTAQLPNVSVTPGPASDQLYIRGVGSGINGGFEQSVATFVDGIYHGRSRYTRGTLVDVERVEVLRGPQSIYFGNNAIGGAFNVTTRRPGQQWEGYVQAAWEFEAEEAVITAAAGGPLTDTLGVRFAGQYSDMKGYLDNTVTGRKNPSPEDRFGRVYFVWQPTDALDFGLRAEKGKLDSEAGLHIQLTDCPVSPPFTTPGRVCANALNFPQIETEFDKRRSAGPGERLTVDAEEVMLSASYSFGGHEVAATLGHTAYDYFMRGDTDLSPALVLAFQVPEEFDQQSVELRWTSPADAPLEWIAGAYWQQSDLTYRTNVAYHFLTPIISSVPAFAPLLPYAPLGNDVVLYQDEETRSLFGSLTWHVTDRLRATAGVRWSEVEKAARHTAEIQSLTTPFGGGTTLPAGVAPLAIPLTGTTPHDVRVDRSDDDVIPSLTVQYDVTPTTMGYATYSEGFKSGGFDALELTGIASRLSFEPETVKAYEVGFKSTWPTVRLNVAAFRNEYKELQQSVSQLAAGSTFFFSVANVGGLRAQGIEADLVWQVAQGVRLSFNAALLDAEYQDYPNAGCTAVQQLQTPAGTTCVQDLTGRAPPFAPEYSGSVGLDWRRPLGDRLELLASAMLTFKGEYDVISDNDPVLRQRAWEKLDLRVGVGSATGNWEVAVLAKNVTDELTSAFGQDTAGLGSYWRLLERPRTIALQGRYMF